MTDTQFWATAVSICTTLCSITSMQLKNMIWVRILQFFANTLLVVQYIITDNISASGVCVLAVVQLVVLMFFQWRGKRFPVPLTLLFMAGYLTVMALSFEKAPDILPGVAACLFALAVVQSRSEFYRIIATVNCVTWLSFDIWSETYSALILHISLLTIDLFTILRLDGRMWLGKIKSRLSK